MKFELKKTALIVFMLSIHTLNGNAADSLKVEKAMDQELSRIERDLDRGKLKERTEQALDILVRVGAQELKSAGFEREAQQWLQSWEGQFWALDLGDHEPLVQWLSDYYNYLEEKLGERVMKYSGLRDIKVFNHGIPVAFHVNGWRGDDWDSEEYKKHFVPLAGAVTYWTCYAICSSLAPPLVGYGCGTMSYVPRYAMERWVAPPLSDRVYKKYRKQ